LSKYELLIILNPPRLPFCRQGRKLPEARGTSNCGKPQKNLAENRKNVKKNCGKYGK
jgi:hypothetical protein